MNKHEVFRGLKKVVDERERIPKRELDKMKIEAFDRILEKSHEYYEVFDTLEVVEHDFDSQAFGEWVEDYIVDFNNFVAEEED